MTATAAARQRSAASQTFTPRAHSEYVRPDATAVSCGQSAVTAERSGLFGLERRGGRVPAGLRPRTVQRLLALNPVIWFNWQIGDPSSDPSSPMITDQPRSPVSDLVGETEAPAAIKRPA